MIVLLAAAMVVVTFNESGGAQVQTELQHSAGGRGQQARHTKLSRAAAETPQRSAQAPPAKAKAVTDLQVTEARITADKFVVQDPVITKVPQPRDFFGCFDAGKGKQSSFVAFLLETPKAFRDSIKEVYVKRVQPAQGCTRPVKVV